MTASWHVHDTSDCFNVSRLVKLYSCPLTEISLMLSFCGVEFLYKKALRETQTLRAGCSKAEPKIFAPPQTPSRGRGTAKI